MRPYFKLLGWKIFTNEESFINFYTRFSKQIPSCFSGNRKFNYEIDFLSGRPSVTPLELTEIIMRSKQFKFHACLIDHLDIVNLNIHHYSSLVSRAEIRIEGDIPPEIFAFDDWEERLLKTNTYHNLQKSLNLMLEEGLVDFYKDEECGYTVGDPAVLYIYMKFQISWRLRRLQNKRVRTNRNLGPFLGFIKNALKDLDYDSTIILAEKDNFLQEVDAFLIANYASLKLTQVLRSVGITPKQWFRKTI